MLLGVEQVYGIKMYKVRCNKCRSEDIVFDYTLWLCRKCSSLNFD